MGKKCLMNNSLILLIVSIIVINGSCQNRQTVNLPAKAHVLPNSDLIDKNKLIGRGLVVGLNGTGDGDSLMTSGALAEMLGKLGKPIDASEFNFKNVAYVIVTAELDHDIQEGDKFDLQVQSIGSARSLEGGTLLFAPLQGPYHAANYPPLIGIAQGPITIIDPEKLTSGTIIGGAIFEGFSEVGHVTMDKVEKTESIDQKNATLVKHIVKLIGIGLVVGLNGTGDGDSLMTTLPLAEMLSWLNDIKLYV